MIPFPFDDPDYYWAKVFFGIPHSKRNVILLVTVTGRGPYPKFTSIFFNLYTPWKMNIAPENGCLECDCFLLGFGPFSGANS